MKFSELKESARGEYPDGLSPKEALVWHAMSYLNALYRFGHVSAEQVKDELRNLEQFYYLSLSPYEKTMQEVKEGGDVLSIAYHLMAAQPDKALWQPVMGELLDYADKSI